MKDRITLVADLLMAAAYSDAQLAGDEKAAVKRLLRELLVTQKLPMDLEFRIDEFNPKTFDLGEAGSAFVDDPPELKRRLLELVAIVHAADGEYDLAEDEFVQRVGLSMGLDEASYRDLVSTVIEEIDLADVDRLRHGDERE
jgi:uncharacterized tellurite resistance protein B-like protein